MLNHKRIKKIVQRDFPREVKRGRIWVVPSTIQSRLYSLREKVKGSSKEELVQKLKEIVETRESLEVKLARIATRVQKAEIASIEMSGSGDALHAVLREYVDAYNEIKILQSLASDLGETISKNERLLLKPISRATSNNHETDSERDDRSAHENTTRQLEVAQRIALQLRQENKSLKARARRSTQSPPKDDLWQFADKCRFKNGEINFSELGRRLGVSNKTAKDWCRRMRIK